MSGSPDSPVAEEPSQVERRLAAIVSADAKEYSRLMGADDVATVEMLTDFRKAMAVLVSQHRGRVVDSAGDSLLAEFSSVVVAYDREVAGRLRSIFEEDLSHSRAIDAQTWRTRSAWKRFWEYVSWPIRSLL
jgi:class 3 adenylate cyclase